MHGTYYAPPGVTVNGGPVSGPSGPGGPSAYQVAVAEGFTGTEADWLASLKGEPGADSTVPGPKGDVGPPGGTTLLATSYTYDTAGRVASVTEGGVLTTYTYEKADPTAVTPEYRVRTDTRDGITRRWWYREDGTLAGMTVVATPLADDFARADGSLNGSATPTGGAVWVRSRPDSGVNVEAVVSGGTTRLSGTTGGDCYATVPTAKAGGCMVWRIAALTALTAVRLALVLRYVDTNNNVQLMFRNSSVGAGMSIRVRVAGASTYVETANLALALNDVIHVEDNPFTGEITVYRNGQRVFRLVLTTHMGATRVGYYGNRADVTSALDDFAWSHALSAPASIAA